MGEFINNFIENFVHGMKLGFECYEGKIEESKWWFIAFVIDMLLIPAKLLILFPICLIASTITHLYLRIKYRSW